MFHSVGVGQAFNKSRHLSAISFFFGASSTILDILASIQVYRICERRETDYFVSADFSRDSPLVSDEDFSLKSGRGVDVVDRNHDGK